MREAAASLARGGSAGSWLELLRVPPAAGLLRLRVLRGLMVDAIKWVIEQKGDSKR